GHSPWYSGTAASPPSDAARGVPAQPPAAASTASATSARNLDRIDCSTRDSPAGTGLGNHARATASAPARRAPGARAERGDLHPVAAQRHAAPATAARPGGVLEQQGAIVRLAAAHAPKVAFGEQPGQRAGDGLEQAGPAVVASPPHLAQPRAARVAFQLHQRPPLLADAIDQREV